MLSLRELRQHERVQLMETKSLRAPAPLRQAVEDVLAFHELMGLPVDAGFTAETLAGRRRLIDEEFREVLLAFDAIDEASEDVTGEERRRQLVQELIDLMYVVLGTFVEVGVDPAPAWQAVHAANLQKVPPGDNGKALKPPSWRPPEVPLERLQAWGNGG